MSKEADEIVKKLEKMGWQDIYDEKNLKISEPFSDPRKATWFYYILEWVVKNTDENDYVLDVGCGVGTLCHLLKKAKRRPTGVEVNQKSIEYCETVVPHVKFSKMYAEKLNFQDGLFDVVASTEVIEHLKEPRIAINEMIRVLKPGGKLLITTPIEKNMDNDGKSKHLHYWDLYQIINLFKEFGDNFKIFYLNKFRRYNDETDEPRKKNIFGIMFIKDGA